MDTEENATLAMTPKMTTRDSSRKVQQLLRRPKGAIASPQRLINAMVVAEATYAAALSQRSTIHSSGTQYYFYDAQTRAANIRMDPSIIV